VLSAVVNFFALGEEAGFIISFICDPKIKALELFVFRYQNSGFFARRGLAIVLTLF
jgi:hypothetical protein